MDQNKIQKEGVLIVLSDKTPIACIRREEKTGHQVVYRLVECGAEEIQELIEGKIMFPIINEQFESKSNAGY